MWNAVNAFEKSKMMRSIFPLLSMDFASLWARVRSCFSQLRLARKSR